MNNFIVIGHGTMTAAIVRKLIDAAGTTNVELVARAQRPMSHIDIEPCQPHDTEKPRGAQWKRERNAHRRSW